MRLTIEHTTEYYFTRPVFFEPHQWRFQPRADGSQRLLRFDLAVEPSPAGLTRALDVEGNVVTLAWFEGIHERMVLRASSAVETLRENPFDYLLMSSNRRLPVTYQAWEVAQLGPALKRAFVPSHADPAREMAEQLRGECRGELVPFLTQLADTIHHRFKVVHRDKGWPWPAATTMEQRQGACRDLAVVFIDVCRAAGLAARFVSGYQYSDDEKGTRDLHAWAEVYIPGAGWRGYDPTNGLAVSDRHVAVAAAADPIHAAPLIATYRGSDVQAELSAQIMVEVMDEVAVPVAEL
jgi:transglutaminase-like putative cysteine protease